MRKAFNKLFLATLFLLGAGYVFAGVPSSENVRYDQAGYQRQDNSYALRITSSGHIFGENAAENRLGDPTYPWGGLVVASGVVNAKDYFSDLTTASTSAYRANGFTISTTTLLASGTTFAAADFSANGNWPRNIVLQGTAAATTQNFFATATVTGINGLGLNDSESILFSTTSAAGNVAWSRVDSISVVSSSVSALAANIIITVGTGVKIGLSNAIGNAGNIYKLVEAGSNVAPASATISTTYNTITFVSAPDGSKDYDVWYHAERSPFLAGR